MKVLVTGGAGYIGSHVVRLLQQRGDEVVIVDDLVTGIADRTPGIRIEQLDLAETSSIDVVERLLVEERVEGVIHFAARKQVGESVARPAWYFQQNIGALTTLLTAMERAGVDLLAFSSSAAVYGSTEGASLDEDAPRNPINPYGETKLVGEWLVADAVRSFGLRGASLRYFNVAGAGWPELGDTAVLNIVPMVFERIDAGLPPLIFGDQYPTPDGTCVRDYIHVLDLAEAHLAALDALRAGEPRHEVINLGTGSGYSVREMVAAMLRVAGSHLEPSVVDARAGDPAIVVADVSRAASVLGWTARLGLEEIVASAWESHVSLAGPAS